MDDDVGTGEGVLKGLRIPDVALAVLQLRPAVHSRVEWPPGDPDDARNVLVGLEQRHQAEPERSSRAGHGDHESGLSSSHGLVVHRGSLIA